MRIRHKESRWLSVHHSKNFFYEKYLLDKPAQKNK